MTQLSINLNKIALLRNSRGRDYPNVVDFAKRFIDLGINGITIHPRPDERHIHRKDAYDLADFLTDYKTVEFNIEGYPTEDFLKVIAETKPDQCTLVPDGEGQLTSDHGWELSSQSSVLTSILPRINDWGVRSAIFLDPDSEQVKRAADLHTDRIELYTEAYASAFANNHYSSVLASYKNAVDTARQVNIGINAGHDLDLNNLATFLQIGDILEVSIGHALTIECIERGMDTVVSEYLATCAPA